MSFGAQAGAQRAAVFKKRKKDHVGFLKYHVPFSCPTKVQSSLMACWISSSVVHFTGIHVMFASNVMYFSTLRKSLCPNACLTSKTLPFVRW